MLTGPCGGAGAGARNVKSKDDMSGVVELLNLARSHQQKGAYSQAEKLCRQILQADPTHADAWCLLGEACELQQKLNEAEFGYRRAIELLPGYGNAHNWLGIVLARQGRLVEAVSSFQQAVRSEPDNAEMHHNLAVALDRLGKTGEAINGYRQALRLRPSFAQAHYNLGLALNTQGDPNLAIESFQAALQYKPDYPEALNDLGNALAAKERLDEAVACYREALRVRPQFADAHYNLGIALGKTQKHEEAMGHFQKALQFKPDFAEAHVHMGDIYRLSGQMDKAFASFKSALTFKPALPQAHWNRALLWLLCGDFEKGWQEYEWRWEQYNQARRHFPQPLWDGSDLGGKTILLYAEQGLGDTMQFVRFVPLAKERGGRVIVECQPQLVNLLTSFPGVDRLLPTGAALPPFDVQAPLLSLAGILRTSLNTIPASVPYLHAKPELTEHWRTKMSDVRCPMSDVNMIPSDIGHRTPRTGHFMIGIAWQGNVANPGDRHRSIPLESFGPIAEVPGVRLLSLQKGPVAEKLSYNRQLRNDSFGLVELGSRWDEDNGAFMDTAAVMKHIDLVITTDTSVAHLAGALAVPVWLAATVAPDWRWLLKREDSPWYPTMRLFRQKTYGQWEDVFHRMAQELKSIPGLNSFQLP
jgi:tetratricopeptide (TPR) repeat protein